MARRPEPQPLGRDARPRRFGGVAFGVVPSVSRPFSGKLSPEKKRKNKQTSLERGTIPLPVAVDDGQ